DCRNSFKTYRIITLTSSYILTSLLYMKSHIQEYRTCGKSQTRVLRSHEDLVIEFHRLKRSRFSVTYWGPRFYNKLPAHIRSLNLQLFKSRVKLFLTEKCYYTIQEYLNDDLTKI